MSSDGQQEGVGPSVATDGKVVVVGPFTVAIGGDTGQGAAYVFAEPAGGWASESGEVDQRLLDEPRHHARIGAAARDRRRPAGVGAPLGEHRLAQRVVGARRVAARLVEIEAGPRLDDGVDVERADLAADSA